MHLSDVVMECAKDCSRLADRCRDEVVAERLKGIALRLRLAALKDAQIDAEAPGAGVSPGQLTGSSGS